MKTELTLTRKALHVVLALALALLMVPIAQSTSPTTAYAGDGDTAWTGAMTYNPYPKDASENTQTFTEAAMLAAANVPTKVVDADAAKTAVANALTGFSAGEGKTVSDVLTASAEPTIADASIASIVLGGKLAGAATVSGSSTAGWKFDTSRKSDATEATTTDSVTLNIAPSAVSATYTATLYGYNTTMQSMSCGSNITVSGPYVSLSSTKSAARAKDDTTSNFSITATVSNLESPTYQWQYRDSNGTVYNITDATAATLSVSAYKYYVEKGYQFRAVATSGDYVAQSAWVKASDLITVSEGTKYADPAEGDLIKGTPAAADVACALPVTVTVSDFSVSAATSTYNTATPLTVTDLWYGFKVTDYHETEKPVVDTAYTYQLSQFVSDASRVRFSSADAGDNATVTISADKTSITVTPKNIGSYDITLSFTVKSEDAKFDGASVTDTANLKFVDVQPCEIELDLAKVGNLDLRSSADQKTYVAGKIEQIDTGKTGVTFVATTSDLWVDDDYNKTAHDAKNVDVAGSIKVNTGAIASSSKNYTVKVKTDSETLTVNAPAKAADDATVYDASGYEVEAFSKTDSNKYTNNVSGVGVTGYTASKTWNGEYAALYNPAADGTNGTKSGNVYLLKDGVISYAPYSFVFDTKAPSYDSFTAKAENDGKDAALEKDGWKILYSHSKVVLGMSLSDMSGVVSATISYKDSDTRTATMQGTNDKNAVWNVTFNSETISLPEWNLVATDKAGNATRDVNAWGSVTKNEIRDIVSAAEVAKINIAFEGTPADATQATVGYYNSMTMTATVTDQFFEYTQTYEGSQAVFKVYKDDATDPVDVFYPTDFEKQTDGTYKLEKTYADDADYKVVYCGLYDVCKQQATATGMSKDETKAFTIDNVAPAITLTLGEASNTVGDYKYYNDEAVVNVKVVEHNFDPAKFSYTALIDSTDVDDTTTGNTAGAVLDPNAWTNTEGDIWVNTITLPKAVTFGTCKVVATCYDKAGNKDEKSENKFRQDSVTPTIEVTYDNNASTGSYESVTYYDKARTATVVVTEHYFAGSAIENGIEIDSVKLPDGSQVVPVATDWASAGDTHTATIEFSAEGQYQLKVSGADCANNTATAYDSNQFAIDLTAPTIKVSWNTTDAHHGMYYSKERIATITLRDNFMDESTMGIVSGMIDNNASAVTLSQWSQSGADYTMTASYPTEGDCTLAIANANAKDKAGHTANLVDGAQASYTWVQDWTVPTRSVVWNTSAATNGEYYTTTRTATIMVYERNFDESLITVSPQLLTGNDGNTGSASVGSWSNDGYYHTISVTYPSEGRYSLTLSGVDLADNTLEGYTADEWIQDWTNPVITISGISNRSAYAGTAQPSVNIADTNASSSSTSTVSNLDVTPSNPYSASQSTSSTSVGFSYNDPAHEYANDGVYRIQVSAMDEAGNTATDSAVWSVNRFGSTYVVNESTEKILGKYVNSADMQSVSVTEINPSGVHNTAVDVSRDTSASTLTSSQYTVTDSGSDGTWYEYEYSINDSVFADNGVYRVTLSSTDSTTDNEGSQNTNDNTKENVNSDRNGSVNLNFAVDNTAPECTIANFDSATTSYNESEHVVSLTFSDNMKIDSAEVTLNGETTKYTAQELTSSPTKQLKIGDSTNKQSFNIKVKDAAGNEYTYNSPDVLVTTNLFAQWANSPLAIGLTIAVVVVIVGLVIFLISRKRRA